MTLLAVVYAGVVPAAASACATVVVESCATLGDSGCADTEFMPDCFATCAPLCGAVVPEAAATSAPLFEAVAQVGDPTANLPVRHIGPEPPPPRIG